MSMRTSATTLACLATLALGSAAGAQDTTRTRDSLQALQRRNAITMTRQVRDSLIAQLLDSASREQNLMVVQRLRDSVTTLRAVALTGDTLLNRLTTPQAMPRQPADSMMQRQPADSMMRRQQAMQRQQMDAVPRRPATSATSDQRVRVRKDG